MRSSRIGLDVAVLIISGYLFAQVSIAQKTNIQTLTMEHPNSTEVGWNPLLKHDFSNAILPRGEAGEAVWKWHDDVLTASEDKALWTTDEYASFILDLEFKNEPGTNSGVIVYASDIDNWIPNSVEIQITDDYHEHWAKSPKTWQCGAIFGRLAASKQMVKPAGEWNRFTIFCEGKNIRVVLNGELVTDLDMTKWTNAKRNPDGSEIPEWLSKPMAELPTHGHVGLQGKHGDASIHFRNVRIKRL